MKIPPMICCKSTKSEANIARSEMLNRGYDCSDIMPVPEEIENQYGEGWYFKMNKK